METATLSIAKKTVTGIRQVADDLKTTIEELVDTAIRRYLRQEAEKKIRREERHFCTQHAQLLDQYAGQFIAMHKGRVVDSDADELVLYLRIRQRFQKVGVLIKQVTPDLEEIWVMRSPRLEYEQ
ncbi:MAG: hypothetical protein ISS49_00620 [Anaerolineae bacterium]|nr:hypothetical protein [Anaerolineae bacterium]